MPSIPLPFVVSFVLGLVLVRMIRLEPGRLGLFPLLAVAFTVQAALSGLNWSLGWHSARLVQPILAAILPALSFTAFDQLRNGQTAKLSSLWPLLVPAGAVAGLVAVWRAPIDLVLFAIYIGYGVALLRVAHRGPGALAATRLGDERTAHRALITVAFLTIVSAFVDAAVSLDLAFANQRGATTILTVASVLWLAVAGYVATIAQASRPTTSPGTADDLPEPSRFVVSRPSTRSPPSGAEDPSDTDRAIQDRIDALMAEQHLYRDPDLTLDRLARRTGIPARQISGALNRIHGRGISQIVNEYRIEDARRRLITTRDPVTVIMLDAGFGTKSNFNREFLRLTGMTPSAYRRAGGEASVAAQSQQAHGTA